MMRKVKVCATQMKCSWNIEENIKNGEKLIRQAAKEGANIILLQELFETPYFCQKHKYEYLSLATRPCDNPAIKRYRELSKELGVVIPVSFFERCGNNSFNSVAVIDSDGEVLGIYRKTHIPDGLPYGEKFYFTPGDTGFKVWNTKFGKIGIGICWDQWFPEAARAMALMGAELLFYPTAIGSDPVITYDCKNHWQNAMIGHSAANIMPVIASNRIGIEKIDESEIKFFGSSFITNEFGEIVIEADRESETYILAEFDLDKIKENRINWSVFRDRRPEMYNIITTYGKEI
ncbi:MAG: N-carbamoylputrescine amidase [Lachnospirales bacterium]